MRGRWLPCSSAVRLLPLLCLLVSFKKVAADSISRYYRSILPPSSLPGACNFTLTGNLTVTMNPVTPPICCPQIEKCISVALGSLFDIDPQLCDATCQQTREFLQNLASSNTLQRSSMALSVVAASVWVGIVCVYNCIYAKRLGNMLIVFWVILEVVCLANIAAGGCVCARSSEHM